MTNEPKASDSGTETHMSETEFQVRPSFVKGYSIIQWTNVGTPRIIQVETRIAELWASAPRLKREAIEQKAECERMEKDHEELVKAVNELEREQAEARAGVRFANEALENEKAMRQKETALNLELEAQCAALREALQRLHDEQDGPRARGSREWNAAMKAAESALSGDAGRELLERIESLKSEVMIHESWADTLCEELGYDLETDGPSPSEIVERVKTAEKQRDELLAVARAAHTASLEYPVGLLIDEALATLSPETRKLVEGKQI